MRHDVPMADGAEQSLLGAILIRNGILSDALRTLDASDFFRPAHQAIYAAMCALHDSGQPIDAVTVHGRLGGEVGAEVLMGLVAAVPSVSAWPHYATQIIDASRRRLAIGLYAEAIERIYRSDSDLDAVLADADPFTNRLIAPRSSEISDLYSLRDFMGQMELVEESQPWLIPHLTKPKWRTLLVAGEGVGKAVLMRFLAVHAAAGRDPWQPDEFHPPCRVLYVDTENPVGTIMHQTRLANRSPGVDIVAECEDRFHIWHREAGMNLRDRRPLAEFEAVLQRTEPQIVFAGPLYKLFRRSAREDLEQAAIEFTEQIDDLRKRYGFAIMLEHHAPKGSGGYRDLSPFGSSVLMRWPELGLTLDVMGGASMTDTRYELEIGRFRRDRVIHDWPTSITRGASMYLPWRPRWDAGRMKAMEGR